MQNLVVLAVTCAATTTAASPCEVNVAHAPDDVRAVIEQWVDKETHCGGPIEVRVVPTDGGLYLFARDQRGRVRERLVPDATAAGVLVASWMADDSIAEAAHVDVHVDVDVTAPAPEGPPMVDAVPAIAAVARPTTSGPSMMLAGILGAGDGGGAAGVRGEIDVLHLGGWRLGAAFAAEHGSMRFDAQGPTGGMLSAISTDDLKALVYLVRPIEAGNWELRPSLALGAMTTTAHIAFNDYPAIVMNADYRRTFPTAELGFTFFRHVADGWDLGGGPVVGLLAQNIFVLDGDTIEDMHRSLELMVELGVRHRL